jgi:hypothetical protein
MRLSLTRTVRRRLALAGSMWVVGALLFWAVSLHWFIYYENSDGLWRGIGRGCWGKAFTDYFSMPSPPPGLHIRTVTEMNDYGVEWGGTPIWWGTAPGIVAVVLAVGPWGRNLPGLCRKCGYDLAGISAPLCPECGAKL